MLPRNILDILITYSSPSSRVYKTKAEIEVLRFATRVSAAAHRSVMRKIRPGMKEYQLEAIFQHHSYYHGGCRHQGYTNICGSGCNAATLHYGHAGDPNLRTVSIIISVVCF